MVDALREAHRVLKDGGLLVDIRPAAAHRRVGVLSGLRWKHVVTMQEDLSDDRAANAAVAAVIAEGLFRRASFVRRDLRRYIGGLRNLAGWLSEFGRVEPQKRDRVIARVTRALGAARGKATIVAVGPIEVRALRKVAR